MNCCCGFRLNGPESVHEFSEGWASGMNSTPLGMSSDVSIGLTQGSVSVSSLATIGCSVLKPSIPGRLEIIGQ